MQHRPYQLSFHGLTTRSGTPSLQHCGRSQRKPVGSLWETDWKAQLEIQKQDLRLAKGWNGWEASAGRILTLRPCSMLLPVVFGLLAPSSTAVFLLVGNCCVKV